MSRLNHKKETEARRLNRVRTTITGTTERPRLSVNISNVHITAQIIDDSTSKTLAYVTTVGQKQTGGTMVEKAAWVGGEIATNAKKVKISKVVFDRGARKYHGRVKALADAARKGGLEF